MAWQNHYTMCAENQAAPKETFDFQAMGCRYNAPRSGGKTAYTGLNSANAESLYHDYSSIMVWMAIRPFPAMNMRILYHVRSPHMVWMAIRPFPAMNMRILYHTAEFHVQIFGAQEKEKYPPGISPFLALIS
nr:hypothetical protein [uncultured Acetatifactor sp.]